MNNNSFNSFGPFKSRNELLGIGGHNYNYEDSFASKNEFIDLNIPKEEIIPIYDFSPVQTPINIVTLNDNTMEAKTISIQNENTKVSSTSSKLNGKEIEKQSSNRNKVYSNSSSRNDTQSSKGGGKEKEQDFDITAIHKRIQEAQGKNNIRRKRASLGGSEFQDRQINFAIQDKSSALSYTDNIEDTISEQPFSLRIQYNIQNRYQSLIQFFGFMPNNKRSMSWDLAITCFTISIIFLESLKIFFYVESKTYYPTNIMIVKSIALAVFATEIFKNFITGACGFFGIAKVEYFYYDIQDTWIHYNMEKPLLEQPVYIQYIYSYFWASCLMINSLVIQPRTNVEVTFTTIVMFFTCIIIAYVISTVGSILRDMHRKKEQFERDLDIINFYMDKKKIPTDLQYRVTNYLEYIHFEENQFTTQYEQHVLKKLSRNIALDITKTINSQFLKNITTITQNFSESTLKKVTAIMEEITLSAQDILFSAKEPSMDLYYIAKGEIEILCEQKGKKNQVKILEQDTTFNTYQFFSGMPGQKVNYTARSSVFTTIYKIPRSEFLQILDGQDFEQFHFIKEQLIYHIKQDTYQQKCFICGSVEHVEIFCNRVHFQTNRNKVMQHFCIEQSEHQQRVSKKRTKHPLNKNALALMKQIQNNYEQRHCEYRALVNSLNSDYEDEENEDYESEDESSIDSEEDENYQLQESQTSENLVYKECNDSVIIDSPRSKDPLSRSTENSPKASYGSRPPSNFKRRGSREKKTVVMNARMNFSGNNNQKGYGSKKLIAMQTMRDNRNINNIQHELVQKRGEFQKLGTLNMVNRKPKEKVDSNGGLSKFNQKNFQQLKTLRGSQKLVLNNEKMAPIGLGQRQSYYQQMYEQYISGINNNQQQQNNMYNNDMQSNQIQDQELNQQINYEYMQNLGNNISGQIKQEDMNFYNGNNIDTFSQLYHVFDKMHHFIVYYPNYNYENQILQYTKYQKQLRQTRQNQLNQMKKSTGGIYRLILQSLRKKKKEQQMMQKNQINSPILNNNNFLCVSPLHPNETDIKISRSLQKSFKINI